MAAVQLAPGEELDNKSPDAKVEDPGGEKDQEEAPSPAPSTSSPGEDGADSTEAPPPRVVGTTELVVTNWNILNLETSKNPFELVGPESPEAEALQAETGKLRMKQGEYNKTTVKEFLSKWYKDFEAARENLTTPEKWGQALLGACEQAPTAEELSAEWEKNAQSITVPEFMTSPKHFNQKECGEVDWKFPVRLFNQFFLCEGVEHSHARSVKFNYTHVFKVLVFDMILDAARQKVQKENEKLNLMKVRDGICSLAFPKGPEARMVMLASVVKKADSGILILEEIPEDWLTPRSKKAHGGAPSLEEVLNLLDGKRKWKVVGPHVPAKKSNSVVALRLDKFEGKTVKIIKEEDVSGAAPFLSVSASPAHLKGRKITIVAFHLPSGETENEKRKEGYQKLSDGRWTLDQALIASGTTNSEPRHAAFKGGNFFAEDALSDTNLSRATDAPWGNNPELPDYGTVNKQRTAMQALADKVGKTDRALKDNVFFASSEAIRVTQTDLCDAEGAPECKSYTFDDALRCFGGPGEEETVANEEAEGARPVPKQQSFPRTCGYVGVGAKFLPDLSKAYGISDHAPISVRFKLEALEVAGADNGAGGLHSTSLASISITCALIAMLAAL